MKEVSKLGRSRMNTKAKNRYNNQPPHDQYMRIADGEQETRTRGVKGEGTDGELEIE